MPVILRAAVLFSLSTFCLLSQERSEQLIGGDISIRPQSAFTGRTPALLWTGSRVPYVIDPDIPTPTRIALAIDYYNANTPLSFQPRVSETNFVHFIRSTIGNGVCSSSVGMIGGEQFIHVEDACTTSTMIHEMGHTAGFFHEQSRHDRNSSVTILYENINKSAYGDFGQNGPPVEQDIGPYDFASHMHYTPVSFSTNNLPVMQTIPPGIPVNSYTELSPGDLDTLFRMYGQPPTLTTLVTNPPGLQMVIDGQTVTSPQTLNWASGSTHTLGYAGQTSGSIRYVFGSWSDGGAQAHTITSNPSATFYSLDFVQQVPVHVGVDASGGGTASMDVVSPDGYFASETVVTMSATPAPGYTFLRWSGGSSCPRANAASPTVIVAGSTAISCLAFFTQSPVTTVVTDPVNLPVTIDGFNYVQTPVNFVWTPGSTHAISTAPPASNPTVPARYIFQGWSDGGAPSHTVSAASGPSTIKASYKTQFNLVLPSFDPAVVTITTNPPSPDNFYDAGTQVTITAAPGPGWTFYQWTRDLTGQPNPATLIMNSQNAVGAVLSQNPPLLAVANSATFSDVAIAPGELVTLFRGPGAPNPIGPANPAGSQLDSTGKLATTVAGTTVRINGVAAPIVYASANQTSVVVPYEIAGASLASVQVLFNGLSTTGPASIDVTAPGFYTANAAGSGEVLAVNQDGTLNSPLNPAVRGSVMTFYASGAGQLSPGGIDGQVIAAPLPVLTQPASLRFSGRPAQLQYAGPAPGEVSGVVQINAFVPLDAPSGNDSLYLVIGANSSPAGVTVAVR